MDNKSATETISIGVVVPVYLGAKYLQTLVERLAEVRSSWIEADAPIRLCEVVFVDDAARDSSPDLVEALQAQYTWVTALHLSRNFGQHAATIAGLLYTSSDWVVTMDEDLQHPPEQIDTLLENAILQSRDIAYARPVVQVHGGLMRDLASRTTKRAMRVLMDNEHIPLINSFRLVRGEIARAAASVCSHDTFLDVALLWFTDRVIGVPMDLSDERHQTKGESGYSFRSLLRHARRMLFSNYIRSVNYLSAFGLFAFVISVLSAIVLGATKLAGAVPDYAAGWTSIMIWIAFFGGLCLLMLGVALQYLSTLTLRAHGKPVFFTIDRRKDHVAKDYFGNCRK